MKKLVILALAAVVGACDEPSRPAAVAEVDIRHLSASVDERVLEVGETAQLTATLTDADGNTLTGREVEWRSSLPSVATVTDAGLVTAVGTGEALVSATAEGVSDEVLIVVPAPPADLACAEGDAGITLAVGQAYTTSGGAEPIICLAGGSSGSEYVMVPFNSADAAQLLQVEVAGSGLVPPTGSPSPALLAGASMTPGMRVPRLTEDTDFHESLRVRERRELGPLVRRGEPGSMPLLSTAGVYADTPTLGDTLRFNVNAEDGCTNPKYAGAVVMAISDRAVVVADTANPAGGFTASEYAHFAETFDTLAYPTVSSNFGTPSDIDNNGERSIILFTKAVNELTPPNSQSFVGGFFFSRDLFPTTRTATMQACPTSNEAEMFYMLVPDPNGEVNNNERSKDFVAQRTVGTLAHEFQHLINAAIRLSSVSFPGYEETWLNEGLSHIAEELTFYAATSLQPRQNLGIDEIGASDAMFNLFVEYQWSNFGRFIDYLKQPGVESPLGVDAEDNDLATRGAIWAFLRYGADRRSGDETTLWRSMVDTDKTGLENLNAAFGGQTLAWMRDWGTALYTDDAVATSPLYQQPSWNFREIITSLRSGSGGQLFPTYPLKVVQLLAGETNEQAFELQGGGSAFLRFGAPAGGRAAIRATSGGVTPPSRLKLTIVRTR